MTETSDPPQAWSVWREVVRAASLAVLAREGLTSRAAWSQWGADYVSGLRRNRRTLAILRILEPLSDQDLRRVRAIARLNQSRISASARWMAIAFVTLPASAAVTVSELEPKVMETFLASRVDTDSLATLGVLGLTVLYQIACAWRARQISTFVDMAMIDRGLFEEAGEAAA